MCDDYKHDAVSVCVAQRFKRFQSGILSKVYALVDQSLEKSMKL